MLSVNLKMILAICTLTNSQPRVKAFNLRKYKHFPFKHSPVFVQMSFAKTADNQCKLNI